MREYAWGKVPVLATATSDVLKLRDLLMIASTGKIRLIPGQPGDAWDKQQLALTSRGITLIKELHAYHSRTCSTPLWHAKRLA